LCLSLFPACAHQISAMAQPAGPAEVDKNFLWLGDLEHALSLSILQGLGITHVLTVGWLPVPEVDNVRVRMRLQVRDDEDEWLGGVFQRAFDFIDDARSAKGRVLVHCREGRSRSAAITIGWLIACRRWSLAQAFERVRNVRPEATPNKGFWEDLVELEVDVRRSHGEKISREAAFAALPSCVKASARRKGPDSIYARYLTAAINDAPSHVLDSVLRMWAPSEWQGVKCPVRKVLLASCESLHSDSRNICVKFLAALMDACIWDAGHVVARSFRKLKNDEEFLADYKLDVPHVQQYMAELEAGFKLHGLIEDSSSCPTQGNRSNEESSDDEDAHDRHWFYFPTGQHFSLPAHWQVKELVKENRCQFRLQAFRSLQPGDKSGPDGQIFSIADGFEKVHLCLKDIDTPTRSFSKGGWWVQKDRLLSVLQAMVSGTPLPPLSVADGIGDHRYQIENGFHRYYASLLLGYTEIPAIRQKRVRRPRQSGPSQKLKFAVGWESLKQKRERLERERLEKKRLEEKRIEQKLVAEDVIQGCYDAGLRKKGLKEREWRNNRLKVELRRSGDTHNTASYAKVACRSPKGPQPSTPSKK